MSIVSLLRRPDGIYVLDIQRRGKFVEPKVGEEDVEVEFVEEVRPVSSRDFHGIAFLQDCFNDLREVYLFNGKIRESCKTLLSLTAADGAAFDRQLPSLSPPEPAKTPRRTAANPRGFQGTKYKPPKQPAQNAINILPYLDGGTHQTDVIKKLGLDLGPGVHDLSQDHADVLRYFGWLLHCKDFEGNFAELMRCYWALDLPNQPMLKRVVASMFGSLEFNSLVWVEALSELDPDLRLRAADILQNLDLPKEPSSDPVAAFRKLHQLSTPENLHQRLYALCRRIKSGLDLPYFFEGIELSNQFRPKFAMEWDGEGAGATAVIRAIMKRTGELKDEWQNSGFALHLWGKCGQGSELVSALQKVDWDKYSPYAAYRFSELLAGFIISGTLNKKERTSLLYLHQKVEALSHLFQSVPAEYTEKLFYCLYELHYVWDDDPRVPKLLEDYIQLLPRICKPPHKTNRMVDDPLSSLTRLPENQWKKIVAAPSTSFLAMEKVCGRKTDSYLIGYGLWEMAEPLAEVVVQGFYKCPSVLMKASKAVGILNAGWCKHLIREFKGSQLAGTEPAELKLDELVRLYRQHGEAGRSLLSKKVSSFVDGSLELSANQQKRELERLRNAWPDFQLQYLTQLATSMVVDGLDPKLDPSQKELKHAALLQISAEENRRGLRKLIRAHLSGEDSYLRNHPLTEEWWRKHPQLPRDKWEQGPRLTSELNGKRVTIEIEKNPLEVLRMGSYAGSCLSIGGGFTFSAAAVALDANKQVAYCRDQSGTVIGRQLLALTEKHQLVCFTVYPLSASPELQKLFHKFDRKFAGMLGLPISDPGDESEEGEEGDIAHILSHDWWYDYPIAVPD